jgi:BCD family chlorophyll transporter-like MFS transporter
MGFNLATVSYFSLAAEISGEDGRSRTTAVMFFIMIVGIILTAAGLSGYLEIYTTERLQTAFFTIAAIALGVGLVSLAGLEKPAGGRLPAERRVPLREVFAEVRENRQVRRFFLYLLLLLAAVLGQDVLLEPYAARAFGMPIDQTTRITTIWGTCYLVALLVAGVLEGRMPKIRLARIASMLAIVAFLLVAAAGVAGGSPVFYLGVVLLGLATGPATVANLSLMLDMTHPGKVGLFIGAWGAASALARLLGYLTTGVVRDVARLYPDGALYGYMAGFGLLALFVAFSLIVLNGVDVGAFRAGEGTDPVSPLSVIERAALAGEM